MLSKNRSGRRRASPAHLQRTSISSFPPQLPDFSISRHGKVQTAMVRLISPAVLRPISNPHLSLTTRLGRPLPATPRCHATQHGLGSEARRRSITPLNDDGNVPWSELPAGEKTARAAQQTVNLSLVVVGVVLTVSYPTIPRNENCSFFFPAILSC